MTGPVAPTGMASVALRPLPARSLIVTGGFWARRQAVNRAVSIPGGWESLEKAGTLGNFRAVAVGGDASQQRGEYFVDTDLYKWLEAAAWELGRGIDDDQAATLSAESARASHLSVRLRRPTATSTPGSSSGRRLPVLPTCPLHTSSTAPVISSRPP